jgi:hypothetical protein
MSWWKRQLKTENSKIQHKMTKLRVLYIDVLDLNEYVITAKLEYNRANQKKGENQPDKPTDPQLSSCSSLLRREGGEPDPFQAEQEGGTSGTEERSPKWEEKEEEIPGGNEKEELEDVPVQLQPWMKKVYRWVAVRYHPDKCQHPPAWFQEWLSAYQRCDWLQFLLFLEDIPNFWEKGPAPPHAELTQWIDDFSITCIMLQHKYIQDLAFKWKKEKEKEELQEQTDT